MARRRRKKRKSRKLFKLKSSTKKTIVQISLLANFMAAAAFILFFHRASIWPVAAPKPHAHVSPRPKTLSAARMLPEPAEVYRMPIPRPPVRLADTSAARALISERLYTSRPKLVFVIDDVGHNLSAKKDLEDLGNKVTYAILPMLQHSREFAQLSRKTGAEVILHMPLESEKGTIPGPGLITQVMAPGTIRDQLDRNFASVPFTVGVNNHMGSGGTENSTFMETILLELKHRGHFFLDSYTTPNTAGPSVARRLGLPVLIRDVFLDNNDNEPAIRAQVDKAASIARRKGYAIAIGHYRTTTLGVLKEKIPSLEKQGFEIVSLKELLRLKRGT